MIQKDDDVPCATAVANQLQLQPFPALRPYCLMLELELFLPLLLLMSPSQVSFNEWFREQFQGQFQFQHQVISTAR